MNTNYTSSSSSRSSISSGDDNYFNNAITNIILMSYEPKYGRTRTSHIQQIICTRIESISRAPPTQRKKGNY